MLEFFYLTFKTSFDKKMFKMSGPQLLQQSKMNWIMQWTIIASSLPIFMCIVCWTIIIIFFFNAEILLKNSAEKPLENC